MESKKQAKTMLVVADLSLLEILTEEEQEKISGGLDSSAYYAQVFNAQLQQQAALYAQITQLNDERNSQLSFLSLAPSVSEKV